MIEGQIKPALYMKYFVLSPNKNDVFGHASRKAIRAYADALFVEEGNGQLAQELINWLVEIEGRIDDENI